jgi:hypothetical protein
MQVVPYPTERQSRRLSATIPISLLMQLEDSKTKHDAWMVDISSKGARVRASLVLSAGQIVGIIPSEDSGQAIPYRVVWVERSASGCIAGLAVVETSQA